jgi:hypothetical protein
MIDSSSNPGPHSFARSHSQERKIAETRYTLPSPSIRFGLDVGYAEEIRLGTFM